MHPATTNKRSGAPMSKPVTLFPPPPPVAAEEDLEQQHQQAQTTSTALVRSPQSKTSNNNNNNGPTTAASSDTNSNHNSRPPSIPSPPSSRGGGARPAAISDVSHPAAAADHRRFCLPPPLPPLPAPPTSEMQLVTVEQSQIRSTIQQACTALARSVAKENRRLEQMTKQPHHAAPALQVALYENDNCVWHFKTGGGAGCGGGPISSPSKAGASLTHRNSITAPLAESPELGRELSDTNTSSGILLPPAAARPSPPRRISFASPVSASPSNVGASANDNSFSASSAALVSAENDDLSLRVSRVADALTAEFILPTGDTKGDIRGFRTRVKAAFAQQARHFKKQLRDRDATIAALRSQLARHEPGGDLNTQWAMQLEDAKTTVAKQDDKIKSLVKLLERTGVAMKKLEKRLAEAQRQNAHYSHFQQQQQQSTPNSARSPGAANNGSLNSSFAASMMSMSVANHTAGSSSSHTARGSIAATAASPAASPAGFVGTRASPAQSQPQRHRSTAFLSGGAVDWNPLYDQLRDMFDPSSFDTATIVRDIVETIENLKEQNQDLEVQLDTAVERFNERDRLLGNAKAENKSLVDKCDEADNLMEMMLADIRKLQDAQENADQQFAGQRRGLEQEKEALQRRVIELEGNIAKSVEAKPFFVGLGRSLAVLPFLRFEGRVKNLDLPKADVEAMIQRIWAKRDPQRESLRRAQAAIIAHLNAAYPGHAVYEPLQISTVPPEDEIVELVDYANVKFVRRTGQNFIDFVTQLLLDKSSSLLYGGEAFDFDASALDGGMTAGGTGSSKGASQRDVFGASKAGGNNNSNSPTTTTRRHRSKSHVLRTGDKMRSSNRDWKNNPSFSVPVSVAEIAYSLMEGSERYKYDADIELFRAIVREEVSELAWFDQMIMLAKLKAALLQAGRMRTGRTGTASVAVILQTLYSFFPCKDRESFTFLRNALMMEARAQESVDADSNIAEEDLLQVQLSIAALFESNEFGNQGPFAEAVRDQHLEEACMYSAEMATAASMAADFNTGRATIADLRAALQEVDPTKPVEEVDEFISKVCAILLDEDGVDPFDQGGASNTPKESQRGGGSSSYSSSVSAAAAAASSPHMSGGVISTPQNNSLQPPQSHHHHHHSNSNQKDGFLSVGDGGGGGGMMKTSSSANFGAHELMIMLEEGRRLKSVGDSDLVDCERFASACRGVFSKRFGPRNSNDLLQPSASSAAFGAGAVSAQKSGVFESHEEKTATWRMGVSQHDAFAGTGMSRRGSLAPSQVRGSGVLGDRKESNVSSSSLSGGSPSSSHSPSSRSPGGRGGPRTYSDISCAESGGTPGQRHSSRVDIHVQHDDDDDDDHDVAQEEAPPPRFEVSSSFRNPFGGGGGGGGEEPEHGGGGGGGEEQEQQQQQQDDDSDAAGAEGGGGEEEAAQVAGDAPIPDVVIQHQPTSEYREIELGEVPFVAEEEANK